MEFVFNYGIRIKIIFLGMIECIQTIYDDYDLLYVRHTAALNEQITLSFIHLIILQKSEVPLSILNSPFSDIIVPLRYFASGQKWYFRQYVLEQKLHL